MMAKPINFNPKSLGNLSNLNAPKVKVNALAYGHVMKALHEGPCTYDDLVEASGLEKSTVRGIITVLVKLGLVRICGWDINGRNVRCITVFEWAPGKKSVPMPKMTGAERSKRYRENVAKRALLQGMNGFHRGGQHVTTQD